MRSGPLATNTTAYIAAAPKEFRSVLKELRRTIKAAAPEAVEVISYGMPAFRLDGRLLVSFAAFRAHCSLFPMSKAAIRDNAAALKGFENSGKGTLRFHPDKPLPATLVKKIVKARVAENAALKKPKRPKKPTKR
jgi:uncharacterized protein YdhG (YjbR/CyaY superfamily)